MIMMMMMMRARKVRAFQSDVGEDVVTVETAIS